MVQWFSVVQNGSAGPWFSGSVVQPPYRGANRLNHSLEPGRAGDAKAPALPPFAMDRAAHRGGSLGCSTLHSPNGFARLITTHSLLRSLHRYGRPSFVGCLQRRLMDHEQHR
jgi:hypothetical protein